MSKGGSTLVGLQGCCCPSLQLTIAFSAVWNASADTTQSTMDVVNKAAHALMGDPKKPADRQMSFRRQKRAVTPVCIHVRRRERLCTSA